MSLTTSSTHKLEQYRASNGIEITPTYRIYRYTPLYHVLIHRQPEAVLSRNPLRRVLQSEFPPLRRKMKVMSTAKIDPKTEIPTAACKWRKETLDLLNAKYDRLKITPFNFDGLKLPDDMQQGMTCLT